MKYRDRPVRVRLGICLVAFFAGFAALGVRIWQLQLVSDLRVERLQESQAGRQITLSSQRGSIYDAKGRELAVSLKVPSIFADPKTAALSRKAAQKLSFLLGIPLNPIERKIRNSNRHFVWLKRQVDPVVGKRVEELGLPGIGVTMEWTRLYPAREMGAQVVGVVGTDGEGLEGVERFYDAFLRSRPLTIRVSRDRKGRPIYTGDAVLREPERGASLHLTLDTRIQHLVENELFQTARASGSKVAMGVVIDPMDGRILAMASYPPVNPNRLDHTAPGEWRNRSVEEVFEPGSTFKVFTLAAALEAGTLRPKQIFNCRKGSLVVSGKVIRNTHDHAWLDPEGVMKFSNNIGAARIGLALGRDRFAQTIARLGFGRRTGIDFPGEERGLLLKPENWRALETANVSFGQGISVTAVQLVAALASVANGGFSVHPRIVERAVMANGQDVEFSRRYEPTRILSPETVRLLHRWMEAVTEQGGTGAAAAMPEYTVAGKTGTAQVVDPATKTYSDKLVTSSFMGYSPASDPRLAAIFVFREPRRADYGGTLAAPVFRRVISAALAYLSIPPDKPAGKGTSPVLQAETSENTELKKGELGPFPDFRGLTIREVLKRAQELSLSVSVVGSGVAVRQESVRETAGKKGADVKVYFARSGSGERT